MMKSRARVKHNVPKEREYLSRIDAELKEIHMEVTDLKRALEGTPELARVEALERRVMVLERELAKEKRR